jgi:hypothetical protein
LRLPVGVGVGVADGAPDVDGEVMPVIIHIASAAGLDADVQEIAIDEIVEEQKAIASQDLLELLRRLGPMSFVQVWETLLQDHMLRVTNVKDACVDLAKNGQIEQTWTGSARKPRDLDTIKLRLN